MAGLAAGFHPPFIRPRELAADRTGGPVDSGIPRESLAHEHRVALTPGGVRMLTDQRSRTW